MAEPVHLDTAAFVAGALDPDEDAAFAEHLADCQSCRDEVVWMSELSVTMTTAEPSLLPDLDATEPPPPPIDLRSAGRRRTVRRLLLATAAAVLLVIGGVAGYLVRDLTPPPDATQVLFDTGTVYHARDNGSRVGAEVAVVASRGGSYLGLRLVDPVGPKQCQLIAVGENGEHQTAMTWTVPPEGFDGTATPPLLARGEVGLKPDEITHFEIKSGATTVLTIPA